MELRHLRTFLAVTEHRSFTRASHSLGITQAAVSQHIAQLETEFKLLLFERRARRVELTSAGELLAEYATQILGLVSQASESLVNGHPADSNSMKAESLLTSDGP